MPADIYVLLRLILQSSLPPNVVSKRLAVTPVEADGQNRGRSMPFVRHARYFSVLNNPLQCKSGNSSMRKIVYKIISKSPGKANIVPCLPNFS